MMPARWIDSSTGGTSARRRFFTFGFLFRRRLEHTRGKLMAALIALAAQAGRATGGAGGRRLLGDELQQHQVAAVANAKIGELDDARVAAVAAGEGRGDLTEQLADQGFAGELLLLV